MSGKIATLQGCKCYRGRIVVKLYILRLAGSSVADKVMTCLLFQYGVE